MWPPASDHREGASFRASGVTGVSQHLTGDALVLNATQYSRWVDVGRKT